MSVSVAINVPVVESQWQTGGQLARAAALAEDASVMRSQAGGLGDGHGHIMMIFTLVLS